MQSAMMVGQWPLGPSCRDVSSVSIFGASTASHGPTRSHVRLATADMFREASPNDLGAA